MAKLIAKIQHCTSLVKMLMLKTLWGIFVIPPIPLLDWLRNKCLAPMLKVHSLNYTISVSASYVGLLHAVMHMLVLSGFSLYKSQEFLHDHLSIFHASFIDECVKVKSCKRVVVGRYFLPPSELHDGQSYVHVCDCQCFCLIWCSVVFSSFPFVILAVRRQMGFPWERNTTAKQAPSSDMEHNMQVSFFKLCLLYKYTVSTW